MRSVFMTILAVSMLILASPADAALSAQANASGATSQSTATLSSYADDGLSGSVSVISAAWQFIFGQDKPHGLPDTENMTIFSNGGNE